MSFGTLFKTLAREAKDRLAAAPPRGPVCPEPLHLRRGGFVVLDTLPFRMLADHTNFKLQACAQPIAARGVVDLNGSWLHRYYLDDDSTWLQVKTDGGTEDVNVSECIVWQYWDTKTPANHAELAQIAGPQSEIGLPTYTIGSFIYQRVWGVSRAQTELIPFTEWVFDKSDTAPSFSCQHHAMLYRRQIPATERQEYALISVEECPDSLQVVTSVGMDLSQADLSVT